MSFLLLAGVVVIPTAAYAAFPAAQATPGQVWIYPGDTEFDWSVTGAEDGTTVTVTYTGCGDQVAGTSTQTGSGDYTFTVYTDPDKLGPDWTRTLTIEQSGFDTYTETFQNSDPDFAFTCGGSADSLVDTWSKKKGKVTHNPRVGQKVAVTATTRSVHGQDVNASVEYAWMAGQTTVGATRSLTIKRAWIGKKIKMVVKVYNWQTTETKTLKYGSVPRLERQVQSTWTCSNCTTEADAFAVKARLVGPDRSGVHVFQQVRHCGTGKWTNFRRQTTTSRGEYDFGADTPKQRRKFHEKRLSKVPTYVSQSSTFIPGNDVYKPRRFTHSYCL